MHIIREDVTEKKSSPLDIAQIAPPPNFFTFVFAPKSGKINFLHGRHPATHYLRTFFFFSTVQNKFGQPPAPPPPPLPIAQEEGCFFSGTCSQTIIITTLVLSLLWYKWPEKLCFGKKYAFNRF